MIDSGLVRRRTTEHLRLPGVQMAIEVDNRYLTVSTIDRPKQRQDNCMVSAESNDAGVIFAVG